MRGGGSPSEPGGPDGRGLVPGRATPEGTARFAGRFAQLPGHFRRPDRLLLSSLALGTRRGAVGGRDDLLYRSAVLRCLASGVNLLDTALSDRMQTSERAVGAALAHAFATGVVARDEVVVVTKGGALVPDPTAARTMAEAQRDLLHSYVDTGLVDPAQVVGGHALEPAFLLDQIERSRRNLGLGTLDLYLVEEPELFLRADGADGFRRRLAGCFAVLEEAARQGRIGAYGVSTWEGLLVSHRERGHLSLVDLFEVALDVGGGDHHLRAVQLPYGLALGEGAAATSQLAPDGRGAAVLDTLRDTGTAVLVSAPLYGGRVIGRVPRFVADAFPEAQGDAGCCLQFARSTAGVTAAVVGMRRPEHLEENLALARVRPADPAVPAALFRKANEGSRR